ncbi:hypothetical protein SERLADRAFT_463930 [Serpula lacrymans var. lacrymans S7.9]|uniref:Uncharacterized protein n=1 Tax=Serpula lacrymans var. lacrymans (strain S7.9) TaxID=578457 RepID=F8NQV5_SERL9|nr:uncharacterized protein SERLADRAFT_463930 [Serpula lacrymans var. lacrymans S7.9]EGO26658.1 hypothetical protein SERLADRAFT_463930 [Serpula lacrymans var. lacrymans S7.9]
MSTLFDTSQSQDIDEWLRQASLPNAVTQYPLSLSQAPPVHSDIVMTQFTQFAPTSDWEKTPTPQLTQSLPHYRTMASTCCNGLCQCSQGSCSCPAECCGCCQGCQCEQPCQDRGYRTTFTVSGERKSCCSPREHHSDSNSPGRHLRPNDGMTAGGYTLNVAIPSRSYTSGGHDLLSVPDMQSRSSSSSSGSSHRSSAQMAGHSFISPTHTRPNMVKTFSQSSPLPVAALSGPNTRPTFMGSYRSAQSSASVSPQPTSPMSGVSCGDSAGYASSSAGSDGSHGDPQFDAYAHYNPSLDAMHLRGN